MNTGVHRNVQHLQIEAMIVKIDRELAKLFERDPTMYHAGDFDELLELRHKLARQVKGLIA